CTSPARRLRAGLFYECFTSRLPPRMNGAIQPADSRLRSTIFAAIKRGAFWAPLSVRHIFVLHDERLLFLSSPGIACQMSIPTGIKSERIVLITDVAAIT